MVRVLARSGWRLQMKYVWSWDSNHCLDCCRRQVVWSSFRVLSTKRIRRSDINLEVNLLAAHNVTLFVTIWSHCHIVWWYVTHILVSRQPQRCLQLVTWTQTFSTCQRLSVTVTPGKGLLEKNLRFQDEKSWLLPLETDNKLSFMVFFIVYNLSSFSGNKT